MGEARAQVFSLAAGALGAAVGDALLSLPISLLWIGAAPIIAGLKLVPLIGRSGA